MTTLVWGRAGVVLRARVAARWGERMRGLLGRPRLRPHEGLLIRPCRAIHTFGMEWPIDVVFLDRRGYVLAVHPHVPPATLRMHWRAASTLELASGACAALGIACGMWLASREGALG
ncbi:DUF192 domain-containing protein [Trinickia mobilis]|uniref:DUF192 domain-containing protein n=1 Tax=Trinickia mobilis TaxID=2816356 RepID=UPI001A8DA16D|nr:DUF192 domain-containing protein [Trinickia mobilis]